MFITQDEGLKKYLDRVITQLRGNTGHLLQLTALSVVVGQVKMNASWP